MNELFFQESDLNISDFLPKGISILTGDPKSGKSWMALGAAATVAGSCNGEAGENEVLFLGLEDNFQRLKNRLSRLQVLGNVFSSRLFLGTDLFPLHLGGIGFLANWVDNHPKTRLIVIDPLQKIIPIDGARCLDRLRKLAIDRSLSIFITHQTFPKSLEYVSDDVFQWADNLDSIWCLKRTGQASEAILTVSEKGKEPQKFFLTFFSGVWFLTKNKTVFNSDLPGQYCH